MELRDESMASYYQTLRIQPDKDLRGKSEMEISNKIEQNYRALIMRAPQMYPIMEMREAALKEIENARAILIDPKKRADYDKLLNNESVKSGSEMVTYEVLILTDEEIEKLYNEDEEENN